jgi:dynein heavy chain
MYGGHITDDWDRRTNGTYLEVLIRPEIMTQMQLTLQPGFKSPDPAKFERTQYANYIEEKLPPEQPAMFGLHPNAEIGYLTSLGETLFSTILSVSGASSGGGGSGESAVKGIISAFLKDLPPSFNMIDVQMRIEEKTPFMIVAIQEAEKMNGLLNEIRFSLTELDQGLDGALNITDSMETLQHALEINVLPPMWAANTNPTKKILSDWFAELLLRVAQLTEWTEEI